MSDNVVKVTIHHGGTRRIELGYKREALPGLREEIPGLLGKLEYGADDTYHTLYGMIASESTEDLGKMHGFHLLVWHVIEDRKPWGDLPEHIVVHLTERPGDAGGTFVDVKILPLGKSGESLLTTTH